MEVKPSLAEFFFSYETILRNERDQLRRGQIRGWCRGTVGYGSTIRHFPGFRLVGFPLFFALIGWKFESSRGGYLETACCRAGISCQEGSYDTLGNAISEYPTFDVSIPNLLTELRKNYCQLQLVLKNITEFPASLL